VVASIRLVLTGNQSSEKDSLDKVRFQEISCQRSFATKRYSVRVIGLTDTRDGMPTHDFNHSKDYAKALQQIKDTREGHGGKAHIVGPLQCY
jgi:hypothetical protein